MYVSRVCISALENDETADKYAKTRIDDRGEIESFRESVARSPDEFLCRFIGSREPINLSSPRRTSCKNILILTADSMFRNDITRFETFLKKFRAKIFPHFISSHIYFFSSAPASLGS